MVQELQCIFIREDDPCWRCWPWRVHHVKGDNWNPVKKTIITFQLKDDLSGADIKAICTEAGLLALRERRMKVEILFQPFSTFFSFAGHPGRLQEVEGECAVQEAGGNPRGTLHVVCCPLNETVWKTRVTFRSIIAVSTTANINPHNMTAAPFQRFYVMARDGYRSWKRRGSFRL